MPLSISPATAWPASQFGFHGKLMLAQSRKPAAPNRRGARCWRRWPVGRAGKPRRRDRAVHARHWTADGCCEMGRRAQRRDDAGRAGHHRFRLHVRSSPGRRADVRFCKWRRSKASTPIIRGIQRAEAQNGSIRSLHPACTAEPCLGQIGIEHKGWLPIKGRIVSRFTIAVEPTGLILGGHDWS